MKLGAPYLYRGPLPPWILNFPAKDQRRSVARLADITRGLEHLLAHYREWGITSLAVPPRGTPHDELPVEFLTEDGAVGTTSAPAATVERVRAAWVALVEILPRIESAPYLWPAATVPSRPR